METARFEMTPDTSFNALDWNLARVGAFAQRLALTLAAVAAALVVAEFATRFVFRHAASSGNAGDYVAHQGGGPQVSTNTLGFRERQIGPKEPNRYRIAVVGDSFTWGQGLEERDRFSNILDGLLGPRYEVLNFGLPGHGMREHVDDLDPVLKLSPDFVLLQLYVNNFETPGMRRPHPYPMLPRDLDGWMARSSIVYPLLNDRWAQFQEATGLVDSYERYMARHLGDPDSPDSRESFGKLRQFFDRTRAAGVPSGAVFFPATDAMGPNGADYPFGFLHDRVKSICVDKKAPYLDLLSTFSQFPDPRVTWVSPFDAHPNAQANRQAAAEILDTFGSAWRR
jgi:hypothetical protein